MKKNKVALLVIGALVAGLTLGGIGIASAAGRTSATARTASYNGGSMTGATSPVATLASLTGLTVQQIETLRAQGKSLSAIATDNGVDPAALVDQTVAARQAYLDTLVAAGRMTAEQEQTALVNIRAMVQAMVDAVPHAGTPSGMPTTTPSVPATGTPAHHMGTGMATPHMSGTATHAQHMSASSGMHSGMTAPHHAAPAAPAAPAPTTSGSASHGMMSGSGSGMGMGAHH